MPDGFTGFRHPALKRARKPPLVGKASWAFSLPQPRFAFRLLEGSKHGTPKLINFRQVARFKQRFWPTYASAKFEKWAIIGVMAFNLHFLHSPRISRFPGSTIAHCGRDMNPRATFLVTAAVLFLVTDAASAGTNAFDNPFRSSAPVVQAAVPASAAAPYAPVVPYGAPQGTVLPAPATPDVMPQGKQVRVWEVLPTDGNLRHALSRWARVDGRPVYWEAPKEVPSVYARYVGSYVEAFQQVMKDTAQSSYQLHGCEYDNAIRVLHSSQSCHQ